MAYSTVKEHVFVASLALGKRLPPGAEVHHVDRVKTNNTPTNLVICPSAAYHRLLHTRMRAYEASGHWDWRLCGFCGVHDAIENMDYRQPTGERSHTNGSYVHKACRALDNARRKASAKQTSTTTNGV